MCVFERAGLTECLLIGDRVSQHFSCYIYIVICRPMPLEVNRCIPLDLFMVYLLALFFVIITIMQSIIACQKHVSLLTIEHYPMVNLSANTS